MTSVDTTQRDELAAIIDDRWHGYGYNPQGAADAILAAGYRKSRVVQYVVVTQDGGVYDCSFGLDRERAESVATQATADAASVGMDYKYQVAEIAEAAL